MTSKPMILDWQRKSLIEGVEKLGKLLLGWQADDQMRQPVDSAKGELRADRQADAFLRQCLGLLDLGVPIVSEEDASHSNERPQTYWLIDPIDGTASWLGGYRGYVTQLALISGGVAHLGVVHAPALGRTYVGEIGQRTTLNGTTLPALSPGKRVILTDNTPTPHGITAALMTSLGADGYYESGSLGLKCCLVADQTADLFLKDVTVRDWDIAPAMPIVSGVGGVLSLADGQPFELAGSYQKTSGLVVARDKDLWRAAAIAAAEYKQWKLNQ